MLLLQRVTGPFNWFAMPIPLNLSLIPRCLLLQRLISKFLLSFLLLGTTACSLEPRIPDRPETSTAVYEVGTEIATITRDEFNIAHIQAKDEKSLMAAWGYVHGMDRLWQMDFYAPLGIGNVCGGVWSKDTQN